MQQKAKMLIPTLPVHSRIDEMYRIWRNAEEHELQRTAAEEIINLRHESRRARLSQAKALLNDRSLRHEVSQKLQASCSLPDLSAEPCGEQTSVLQLLNRRVDVNRLKHCRLQAAQRPKMNAQKYSAAQAAEFDALLEDINRFENDNLPDVQLQLETIVDWHNSAMDLSTETFSKGQGSQKSAAVEEREVLQQVCEEP
jgi:hypothetical protein